jgi:cytochrome P450
VREGAFAITEAVLLLATIAGRFRLTLEPGHPVALSPTITLRPKHGMRMPLHQRTQPGS